MPRTGLPAALDGLASGYRLYSDTAEPLYSIRYRTRTPGVSPLEERPAFRRRRYLEADRGAGAPAGPQPFLLPIPLAADLGGTVMLGSDASAAGGGSCIPGNCRPLAALAWRGGTSTSPRLLRLLPQAPNRVLGMEAPARCRARGAAPARARGAVRRSRRLLGRERRPRNERATSCWGRRGAALQRAQGRHRQPARRRRSPWCCQSPPARRGRSAAPRAPGPSNSPPATPSQRASASPSIRGATKADELRNADLACTTPATSRGQVAFFTRR